MIAYRSLNSVSDWVLRLTTRKIKLTRAKIEQQNSTT